MKVGAGGFYVRPAIVEMPSQTGPVERETFAPILYVMKYKTLAEAIAIQNAVGAGRRCQSAAVASATHRG